MSESPDQNSTQRCSRIDCTAVQGGTCVLGHADPEDCDEFDSGTFGDADSTGQNVEQQPSPMVPGRNPWRASQQAPVYNGGALTLSEGTAVRQQSRAKIIVPIGRPDVGKTTLNTAIYEALASRAIPNMLLAETRSLIGYEERSFTATTASGRVMPDTPRTSRSTDRVLLHLSLRHDLGPRTDLLFADLSGEHAEALRIYDEPGPYGPLLRCADSVIILLDGAELEARGTRNRAVSEARTLARVLAEGGHIVPGTQVLFLVTKGDLCPSFDLDELRDLVREVEKYGHATHGLKIAARGPDGFASSNLENLLILLVRFSRNTSQAPVHRLGGGVGEPLEASAASPVLRRIRRAVS